MGIVRAIDDSCNNVVMFRVDRKTADSCVHYQSHHDLERHARDAESHRAIRGGSGIVRSCRSRQRRPKALVRTTCSQTIGTRAAIGRAESGGNRKVPMHAHAQTARAVRRSIKERLARVEQAVEACWEQILLATALEGELARPAKLGELDASTRGKLDAASDHL